MKTQLEYFKEVIRLSEENPTAEIKILATSDEILEDCAWTAHKIASVEVGHWYESKGGKIYIDLDDIVDCVEVEEDKEITKEDARKLAMVAILVETDAE